jgi:hypothetical protein
MPIIVTMAAAHEPDGPGRGASGNAPDEDSSPLGTGTGKDRITGERLAEVIRRLESGFYDAPEVREHVARRVREELNP